jgi:hypothetical protein
MEKNHKIKKEMFGEEMANEELKIDTKSFENFEA